MIGETPERWGDVIPYFMDERREELEDVLGLQLGAKLGCGVNGCVYEVADDPGTAVKVTCDSREGRTWVAIRDLQRKGKARAVATVKRIFRVFGSGPYCELYLVVREAVAGASDHRLSTRAAMGLEQYTYHDRHIGIRILRRDERTADLVETMDELRRSGIDMGDLHEDNVGQRADGQVVIRDPTGYGEGVPASGADEELWLQEERA